MLSALKLAWQCCRCSANAWIGNSHSQMNDVIKTEFLLHSNKGIHKSVCAQNCVSDEPHTTLREHTSAVTKMSVFHHMPVSVFM